MHELRLVKGYKEQEALRKSFNQLASQIFGINFENWYQKGYWTDKYVPYSFTDGNKVVASISVNIIDMLIKGEQKRGLQIGTVMTHPDHRNKGLSRKLMNTILEDYENKYDIMYLFANDTVLNFYPKFGFKEVTEHQFSVEITGGKSNQTAYRKLDGTKDEDLHFIYQFASKRVPVSNHFNSENTKELLMFYCMYVFSHDIYYLENEGAIVIYKKEAEQLHIFDIISDRETNMRDILEQIADPNTKKAVFHFTPNCEGIPMEKEAFKGSEVLFVKSELSLPADFKHPITAQA
jgi:predicted N-acetyltransferase YhbS